MYEKQTRVVQRSGRPGILSLHRLRFSWGFAGHVLGYLIAAMVLPAASDAASSFGNPLYTLYAEGTSQPEQRVTWTESGRFEQTTEVEGTVWFGEFPEGSVRGASSVTSQITQGLTEGTFRVTGWGTGLAGTAFGSGAVQFSSEIELTEPTSFHLDGLLQVTPFDTGVNSWRTARVCFHPEASEACQIDLEGIFFEDEFTEYPLEDSGQLEPGRYTLSIEMTAGGTFAREGSAELQFRLEFAPTPTDFDALGAAIRSASTDLQFDLDGSSTVDVGDLEYLLVERAATWFGDANLDGSFDTLDLVQVFQTGEYDDTLTGNSTWATGDWNQDGEFDNADLVLAFQDGGYLQGNRPAALPVPEPASCCLTLAALGISAALRRRR
jgi:hypothetical protein